MSEELTPITVTDEADLRLNRALRELPREVDPDRDLWRGIESRIVELPQPHRRRDYWQPMAIAASLLLAVSALIVSLQRPGFESPEALVAVDPIANMESNYLQVRTPMLEQFNQANRDLDDRTLQELHRNLEILAEARRDIEAAVREEPDNPRLVELLISIHEQEMALLRQDFSKGARYL